MQRSGDRTNAAATLGTRLQQGSIESSSADLPNAHVHVWSILLDVCAGDTAYLHGLLGADERLRARRFRFERDRERYILRRGYLRLFLAEYLHVSPDQIRYCVGTFQKPRLASPLCASQLHFSLSHSGDRALIAIARDREIGVDVEQVKPLTDMTEVAASVLSERERLLFHPLCGHDRIMAFYKMWTQKEAYLKGRGLGLNQHPSEINVAFLPTETASLLRDCRDHGAPKSWSLVGWEPAPGYVAALAMHGRDCRLSKMSECQGPLTRMHPVSPRALPHNFRNLD